MYKRRHVFIYAIILFLLTPLFIFSADNDKIPVTTKSETAKTLFMQARELGDNLNIPKALEAYTKAINEDPNFALAYAERSTFQNSGKDVVSDIQKAVSLKPNVSEGEKLFIDGLEAGLNRDIEKQRDSDEKLVSMFPNDERAHVILGQFYMAQREDNKAITEFQKAADINPKFASAYNMMGYAYKNLEKYTEAENAFQKYISLIPNDPNPYDSYGELLLKEGKFDQSIQNYQKALSISPDFTSSKSGIIMAYIYQGNFDKARSEINNFLSSATTNPDKETAHRLLGISYIYEGNLDKALSAFQDEYKLAEAENDFPDLAAINVRLANVLYEKGNYSEAKDKLKESAEAYNKSMVSEDAKANYKSSLAFDESLIALKSPDSDIAAAKTDNVVKDANLNHQLNSIKAIEKKDGDASLNELNQANQNDPYVQYLMGRSYQLKGDESTAKMHFDKAINFNGLPTVNSALAYYNAKKFYTSK